MIYLFPGAINCGLLSIISNLDLNSAGEDIYKKVAISPEAVVNAALHAVIQPDDVDVSDLIFRPSLKK